MALPVITIVLIGFGAWAYLVRNFMVGIMQEDFISAKKTIGISRKKNSLQSRIEKRSTTNCNHTCT